MFVPFGFSTYESARYELAPVVLENWFAEPAPDNAIRNARLVPAPGLVESDTGFSGIGRALFRSDGVLSGDTIVHAGSTVYRVDIGSSVTALTGAIDGTDTPTQFAATQTPELVLVASGKVYLIGATAVTEITSGLTGAGATGAITSVTTLGQRFFFTEAGSGRVFYSDTADASTIDGFVTAESDPDEVRAVKSSGNTLWIFGSERTEAAYLTGDDSVPVAFRPAVAIPYGVLSSNAVADTTRGLFFVGSDARIYALGGGQPAPISTQPIVSLIEGLSDTTKLRLHTYKHLNHEWLVLNIPGAGDFFYDIDAALWHTRPRNGSTESGVGPVVRAPSGVYCIDNVGTGNTALLKIDADTFTNRGNLVTRRATALVPNDDAELRVRAVSVECQAGVGLDGNGLGSAPQMFMEVAKDGRAFAAPISREVGRIGEFRRRVVFGPFGIMRPGIIAVRISVTDPVGLSVTGAFINPSVRR